MTQFYQEMDKFAIGF